MATQTLPERIGEAFELDARLTVAGRKLEAGDPAPEFELDHFDPTDNVIHSVKLANSTGQIRLLNVINSLDTPVCHIETHHWDKLRDELPPGVVIYTISMDLPFAQDRWQKAEHVTHAALSGHRSEKFGQDYGVLIKEWRLLQRAVFVIDATGHIVYAEYVADQMREPDYKKPVQVVRQLSTANHG